MVTRLLFALGMVCALYLGGNDRAFAADSPACVEQFKAEYFAYRFKHGLDEYARLDTKVRLFRNRALFDPSNRFQSDVQLLGCAAEAGDQLALYVLGSKLLAEPADLSEFIRGWESLGRAAQPKPSTASDCWPISETHGYECASGLPEAHFYLGSVLSNCRNIIVYQPKIAAYHLEWAVLSGAGGTASNFRNSLNNQVRDPHRYGCVK